MCLPRAERDRIFGRWSPVNLAVPNLSTSGERLPSNFIHGRIRIASKGAYGEKQTAPRDVMQDRSSESGWMPRYFFHLHDDEIEIEDPEGLVLPDDEVALERASKFARDLLAAAVLEGRLALHERIVVQDENGRSVLTLSFGQAVGLPK